MSHLTWGRVRVSALLPDLVGQTLEGLARARGWRVHNIRPQRWSVLGPDVRAEVEVGPDGLRIGADSWRGKLSQEQFSNIFLQHYVANLIARQAAAMGFIVQGSEEGEAVQLILAR